jgi:hypothetical protein
MRWCGIDGVFKDGQECKLNSALCGCGGARRVKLLPGHRMEWEPAVAAPKPEGPSPIDMVLHCPACGDQHIDRDESPSDREWAAQSAGNREVQYWTNPPHRSHLCRGCGHIWRPADVPTNGVAAVKTAGKSDSEIVESLSANGWHVRLGAQMEVTYINHFRNGTAIVTIKRKPRI